MSELIKRITIATNHDNHIRDGECKECKDVIFKECNQVLNNYLNKPFKKITNIVDEERNTCNIPLYLYYFIITHI